MLKSALFSQPCQKISLLRRHFPDLVAVITAFSNRHQRKKPNNPFTILAQIIVTVGDDDVSQLFRQPIYCWRIS
jgi:hypothetical protein